MLLMRPLFTATSAVYTSPPVPSTIVPPRTSKSTKVRLTRHDLVRPAAVRHARSTHSGNGRSSTSACQIRL